ncbi:MAG: hypothetical protein V9H26_03485 [Verrucomicrobiota bacterium]
MRHRAPLFMAQVDPTTLRVLRRTEKVVVPERGAELGQLRRRVHQRIRVLDHGRGRHVHEGLAGARRGRAPPWSRA